MSRKTSCEDYVNVLSSSAPTPGGGSAAALVGSIGISLGNMVGSLTVGKEKYADVEKEVQLLIKKASILREEFLDLMEEDAKNFEALSAAYKLPAETEQQKAEKEKVLEDALRKACEAPLDLMVKCGIAIEAQEGFAKKGNKMVVSDAAIGVVLCKAALESAAFNIYINTKAMKNRESAETLKKHTEAVLKKYSKMADEIAEEIRAELQ